MAQTHSHPRTPEEYQEEMMRLYRASRQASQTPPVTKAASAPAVTPETPIPKAIPEEPSANISSTKTDVQETPNAPIPLAAEEKLSTPAPTPQTQRSISNETTLETQQQEEKLDENPTMDEKNGMTDIGWIQVITRSAGNALPLEGVSVLITNGSGKSMKLEQVAVTDESGETKKIPLPAPPPALSLNSNETAIPYSTYDVSVYAAGYYRQISEKVPVFAGTTSRQVFSMIPLPSYLQETPEPIVFQNTEPDL